MQHAIAAAAAATEHAIAPSNLSDQRRMQCLCSRVAQNYDDVAHASVLELFLWGHWYSCTAVRHFIPRSWQRQKPSPRPVASSKVTGTVQHRRRERNRSNHAVAISPVPPHHHRRVQRRRRCRVGYPTHSLRQGENERAREATFDRYRRGRGSLPLVVL